MYSQVINYIKQRVEISREEIEESLKYSDFKKFAKGDYILRAGEYCRFIGFLNKGFIVTTFVDDSGNEKASEFKHEDCFLKWINTSVSHNQHHQYFKGNYGLYFTIWDRLMGTLRPDYDKAFENLKQREKPLPEKCRI